MRKDLFGSDLGREAVMKKMKEDDDAGGGMLNYVINRISFAKKDF